jgi:sensor histidine kinase YesM
VTIRLTAHEEAGRLHIKVKDNGEGAAGENGDDGGGTGVGLRNVRERLIARFGDRAGCLHGPDPDGGYTVHLYMPVARG